MVTLCVAYTDPKLKARDFGLFWNGNGWNRNNENDFGHCAPGMRITGMASGYSGIEFAMKKKRALKKEKKGRLPPK